MAGTRLISLCLIAPIQFGVWNYRVALSQALPTVEQTLHARGIGTSKQSLIAALRTKDVEIRALAAEELAEKERQQAKPILIQALKTESDPGVRVKIAYFLAKLGEPIGRTTLRSVVNGPTSDDVSRVLAGYALARLGDSAGDNQLTAVRSNKAASPSLRIRATVYAHALHRDYCDTAVPDILETSQDMDAIKQALNLLPNLKTIESDRQKSFEAV